MHSDKLPVASSPTVRSKLSQLLSFAARGVLSNPTATPHDMLSFIYATLDDCLEREEAAREHAEAIVGAAGLIEAGACAFPEVLRGWACC